MEYIFNFEKVFLEIVWILKFGGVYIFIVLIVNKENFFSICVMLEVNGKINYLCEV